MKITKSFTLSEEAVGRLPEENASQFVNDAIIAYKEKVPWASLEYRIEEIKGLLEKHTPQKNIGLSPDGEGIDAYDY